MLRLLLFCHLCSLMLLYPTLNTCKSRLTMQCYRFFNGSCMVRDWCKYSIERKMELEDVVSWRKEKLWSYRVEKSRSWSWIAARNLKKAETLLSKPEYWKELESSWVLKQKMARKGNRSWTQRYILISISFLYGNSPEILGVKTYATCLVLWIIVSESFNI